MLPLVVLPARCRVQTLVLLPAGVVLARITAPADVPVAGRRVQVETRSVLSACSAVARQTGPSRVPAITLILACA